MDLFRENTGTELVVNEIAAKLGCHSSSVSENIRRMNNNGWRFEKTGRGVYKCMVVGASYLDPRAPVLPSPKKTDGPVKATDVVISAAAEATQVAPEPSYGQLGPYPYGAAAPLVPDVVQGNTKVVKGDLLEISHVTGAGVIMAVDDDGNVYIVKPVVV